MSEARQSITRAAVAGFGFAVAEVVSVWMNPAPLDPVPTWTVMLASVVGTTVLLAAIATVMCALSHRHAGVLALAAWAAVWGPSTAERAGWHRVGWAPAVVVAGLGPYAPVAAVTLTVASGAAGPALRAPIEAAIPAGSVRAASFKPPRMRTAVQVCRLLADATHALSRCLASVL